MAAISCMIENFGFYCTFYPKKKNIYKIAGYLIFAMTCRNVDITEISGFSKYIYEEVDSCLSLRLIEDTQLKDT